MRCIVSATASGLAQNTSWSTPMPPSELQLLRFHRLSSSDEAHPRMVAFSCDDPAVTGYSACWYGGCVVSLHAHLDGEDLAFYQDIDAHRDHTLWIYTPLNPGEFVSELWKRTGRIYRDQALVVRTSLHAGNLALLTFKPG